MQSWINSFRAIDSEFPILSLYFLGDAIGESCVLHLPGNFLGVVDAYGGLKKSITTTLLKSLDVETIDLLILSHLHSDHYNGMPSIFDCFSVESFAKTCTMSNFADLLKISTSKETLEVGTDEALAMTPIGKLFLELSNRGASWGKKYRTCDYSSVLGEWPIGENNGTKEVPFEIFGLGPHAHQVEPFLSTIKRRRNTLDYLRKSDDAAVNKTSSIIRFSFGETVFLTSGDTDSSALNELTVQEILGRNEVENLVVKVPHHGSNTSNARILFSSEIQRKTKKRFAVISPYYRYRLPKNQVIEEYKDAGYLVSQTCKSKAKQTEFRDFIKKKIPPTDPIPRGIVRISVSAEGETDHSFFKDAFPY
jgi:hypothetical protein